MSFVFVSGRASLDFAGTLKWRHSSVPEEQLTSPERLSDWALAAGLADAPMDVTNGDLAAGIELREAIYRTITARIDGHQPGAQDVTLLNRLAQRPQLVPRLDTTGAARRQGTAQQLFALLAADLLDLLASADTDRTKHCANAACTRLYVDSSRTGNRRWCGMRECGNRAKVENFRARQRASIQPAT